MGNEKYEGSYWNPDKGDWSEWKAITYDQYCRWFGRTDLDVKVRITARESGE